MSSSLDAILYHIEAFSECLGRKKNSYLSVICLAKRVILHGTGEDLSYFEANRNHLFLEENADLLVVNFQTV